MRHYKLLHPRNYLAAPDLADKDGNPKDFTLTIGEIKHEELTMEGGRKDVQPVITFKEAKKRFVLNKTNAKTIAHQHGDDVDSWVGKQVTLYPTTCKAKGEVTDCIRIRPGKGLVRAHIAE